MLHCSGARGRRGVQAGIAEKKISILERALEFHPGSDRLLMALLDAVSPDCCICRCDQYTLVWLHITGQPSRS